ncbi:MAG: hypothetical protein HYU28_12495 [Actinobacteria bacterium]|nr:hypothetical protein [Actinomycetota bacterium]
MIALALATGCGGAGGRGALAAPKLKPVAKHALRDFDAGLRALKLGGPEADFTDLVAFARS